MRTLLQDLRYGLRVLRNSPGFTAAAVLTLALGIAANTTVFGWIDALLVHPFPGATDGGRLAAIETVTPTGEFSVTSWRDYRDYRDDMKLASGVAASLLNPFAVGDSNPQQVRGEYVSSNYFEVLGVKAELGRGFQSTEFLDARGSAPMAVISDRLWKQRFRGDRAVIGRTVRVNKHPLTVVGVAPPAFRGAVPGLFLDIWVPMVMAPDLNGQGDWLLNARGARQVWVTARLKPGVDFGQANAEVEAIAGRIAKIAPNEDRGVSGRLMPVWTSHHGLQWFLLTPLRILMAVCGVLLLIVAANVANLQLARATARQKEFSVRLALGAGSRRLIRQMVTESLLIAIAGAAAGVVLSQWMGQSLAWLLPTREFPLGLDFTLNGDILAFAVLLCLILAVITGLAPALYSIRTDVSESLKESGRTGASSAGLHRARGFLVVAEVALAMVALVGLGLFTRSFMNARNMNPGFDPRNVLLVQYHLDTFCSSEEQRLQFTSRLRERLLTQPGIAAVGYGDDIPLALGDSRGAELQVEGYEPRRGEQVRAGNEIVSPGYFDALGIRLLAGRDFTEQDTSKTAQVAIVNQTFARRYFAGGDPVGHRIGGPGHWITVVGMVKDSKYRFLTEASIPYVYVPYSQWHGEQFWMAFFIRTLGPARDRIATVRREATGLEPASGAFPIMPFEDHVSEALFPQRVPAALLSVLGVMAILLAALGLYGVLAFAVGQRAQEFGIRVALGAQTRDVLGLVIRQGMLLTLAGLVVGAALALTAARLVSGMLVNLSATDPFILAGAGVFLTLVAFLATWLPARSATRLDPIASLRRQ